MNKTLLVLGGAGFIGTNICLEAKKRGYDVFAFDSLVRPGSEENLKVLKENDIDFCRGDVRFMPDLHRMPIPDAIFSLSANPGIPWSIQWPVYDFEVNAKGDLNVLEYARVMGDQLGKNIPVIFASTNKVYSDIVNEIPLRELDTRYEWDFNEYVKPDLDGLEEILWLGAKRSAINEHFPVDGFSKYHHSPYGASKLSADQYHQEYYQIYGVPTVVNRMSCIYGLHQNGVQDQGWIDFFVRKIVFGDGKLNFFGDGKQVRDMLWGGDVAKLYLDELENIDKVKGQVFNVGGGINNTLSLIEAVKTIEDYSGKKANIEYHDWRPADQKIYISDTTKVTKMLNWKPEVSPAEGIKRMVDYYRKNGI